METGIINNGYIKIENGKINKLGDMSNCPDDDEIIDLDVLASQTKEVLEGGSDEVIAELLKRKKNLWLSVSTTSRPIRTNDIQGTTYNFGLQATGGSGSVIIQATYGNGNVALRAANYIILNGNRLTCTVPAANQSGIYARFA